jgi:hypothetical protein
MKDPHQKFLEIFIGNKGGYDKKKGPEALKLMGPFLRIKLDEI